MKIETVRELFLLLAIMIKKNNNNKIDAIIIAPIMNTPRPSVNKNC